MIKDLQKGKKAQGAAKTSGVQPLSDAERREIMERSGITIDTEFDEFMKGQPLPDKHKEAEAFLANSEPPLSIERRHEIMEKYGITIDPELDGFMKGQPVPDKHKEDEIRMANSILPTRSSFK